ncbi:hypothetical protein B0J18DRAFT_432123 [Chaetomium sp. MPI-SDFR-AT-0129]|nr:hypothetical protein B0J18DRAFT_432123 [Chaetomium sp. MPI-SDFR-AT-0129]
MSLTITTIPSPSHHSIEGLRLANGRPLITSVSRPDLGFQAAEAVPVAWENNTPATITERPTKRARVEANSTIWSDRQFLACLDRQVYPHINAQTLSLPDGKINRFATAKQLAVLVADADFVQEYYNRGNGTVSLETEARVAYLASSHVRSIALRLGLSPPASTPHFAFHRPPENSNQPRPTLHLGSETPPLPRVQDYPQALSHAAGSSTKPWPPAIDRPAGLPVEVIVIDDDDARVAPQRPVPTKAPTTSTTLVGAPVPIPPRPAILPKLSRHSAPPKRTAAPVRPSTPPQGWRAAAHASVWHGGQPLTGSQERASGWFSEQRRPYMTAAQRRYAVMGAQTVLQLDPADLDTPATFHVDFSTAEVSALQRLVRQSLGLSRGKDTRDPKKDLAKVLKKNPHLVQGAIDAIERQRGLPKRAREDIDNFIQDLLGHKTAEEPLILTISRDDHGQEDFVRSSRVHSLLLTRELVGQRGVGSMRSYQNFNNGFRKCREDALEKQVEWTGCSGDVTTITWVSDDGFLCGCTNHSDPHNQQYNKTGNLVLGSCTDITLRAYPEHRIVRPIVETGENSTHEMRESQPPWLYTSVVSSDYDAVHGRAFTSSFDKTVKVWKVDQAGTSMDMLGEWRHDGNVNFVAASKHQSGMVATAADVVSGAVRIYDLNPTSISQSPFRSYSCSRVIDDKGNDVSIEKWAYFPATMQWGLADNVKHLLLVGYSPRSRTHEDSDIPVERRGSGELCLWDGLTGERWRVTSATTQNVFEVLWHPTQECFIAATSPLGLDPEPNVHTQIRIFRPANKDEFGVMAYSPVMTLDCRALDINELTIMPNSFSFCYITAGCTDGNTYVWDTARGDKPIHVLRHGDPIDPYRGNREREDVGVKFTAWGSTPDRFYTGSSDGVLKVWNVRSLSKQPLVRNLFETAASITAGMFNSDKTRLIIGDASGRVFMLSIDEEEEQVTPTTIPGPNNKPLTIKTKRPKTVINHPDPPNPTHDAQGHPIDPQPGRTISDAYLTAHQLERHPNPMIGAVQGPRYAELNIYCRDLHFNGDPTQPLLATVARQQQEVLKPTRPFATHRPGRNPHGNGALRPVKEVDGLGERHERNRAMDLDVEGLSEESKLELMMAGVDLDLGNDYLLREEED